ncbi:MAG: acetyl-CoA carboxylase biotin carboxyl carrier protein subunit [Candidatus Tectomicrobia bacterium]|uniref:Acetyl-CoA carboxylase biotin carboxyl carrier protein subunit n=1 Tax=Tectimicrobiota bacterium TaxID=2528274 RepID=A0A933GK27_UNCTE|nr:acetyl-CoA carboxylase biotin carboxyl carrier protein subunit [Candidatus Tectomicrobia bacterium]
MTDVVAPMVGKVVRIVANVGQKVEIDDPVVIIESMKMENQVVAPESGVIKEIKVSPGDVVKSGTVMAVIE